MTPHDLFEDLAAEQLRRPEVSRGPAFRSDALKIHGKIFALLSGDRMVVKIPAARAAAMVAAGEADPFESGGRKMREWVTVPLTDPATWRDLMAEAATYVSSHLDVRRS